MVVTARSIGLTVATGLLIMPLCAPPSTGATPIVSSAVLVEQANEWDGKRVMFQGEVVGAAMRRGPLTWLHVNDDPYAVQQAGSRRNLVGYNSGQAIRIPSSLTTGIESFGAHQQQGDIVRVEGVFLAADPRAGGDMLIDADSLSIVSSGRADQREVSTSESLALMILSATTIFAYLLMRQRKQRHMMR